MVATSFDRGHEIYFNVKKNRWYFVDNDTPILYNKRECKFCGKKPTKEGYDACLGHIEGAMAACCGHGVETGDDFWKELPKKK